MVSIRDMSDCEEALELLRVSPMAVNNSLFDIEPLSLVSIDWKS